MVPGAPSPLPRSRAITRYLGNFSDHRYDVFWLFRQAKDLRVPWYSVVQIA
jgi:hypothetical protein